MPDIEVEPGLTVYAQDVGAGRPVVLIAGFGLNHAVWDSTVRALLDGGYRAVCIDLRGTGRSSKPAEGYAIERLGADVVAVLEALDLQDVTLAGWSFGGQVSLRVAADVPERVAQLALIGSSGVRASPSEEFPFGPPADKVVRFMVRGEIENRVAARADMLERGFKHPPHAAVLDFLQGLHLQMPSWAAIHCAHTYQHSDLTDALERVRVPTLLLTGDADAVTPPAGADWVAARLADARVVKISDCGHMPMFEARERFDAELLGFLGEV